MLHLLKILCLLPEKDIMKTLEDFGITKENDMNNTANGFIVLDEKDIIKTDTPIIKLNPNIKRLTIYPYNKSTYTILSEVFSNKQIIKIEFISTQDIILDMTSYESVRNTYNILNKFGEVVNSDEDLINLATRKIVPCKKLIITQRQFGKSAFPNSKVKQYKFKVIYCYDISLIVKASKV